MSKSSGKWVALGVGAVAVTAVAVALFVIYGGDDSRGVTEVTGIIRQTPPLEAKPQIDNAFDDEGRLRSRAAGTPGEDSMVPWGFVTDVSEYIVEHYFPANTRQNPSNKGIFTLGYKQLNMRYGLEVSYFGHDGTDENSARKQIFEYVFRPGILTTLHTIYAESFIKDLALKAGEVTREFKQPDGSFEQRPLNSDEVAECLGLVSGFLREGGRVLRAMAANERVLAMLPEYETASRQVNQAYLAFNDLRDADGQKLSRASEDVKQTIEGREELRRTIIKAVRRDAGGLGMSDDSIFYLVQWGARRMAGNPDRNDSLAVAAKLLDDMAGRLGTAAAGAAGAGTV